MRSIGCMVAPKQFTFMRVARHLAEVGVAAFVIAGAGTWPSPSIAGPILTQGSPAKQPEAAVHLGPSSATDGLPSQFAAALPAPDEPVGSPRPRGESLDNVLHSMMSAHSAGAANQGKSLVSEDDPDAGDSTVDEVLKDAYRWLLNNETLGAALRNIVTVEVTDDGRKSFELLGVGHFSFQGSDSGEIVLTEASTGLTLPVASNNRSPDPGEARSGDQKPTVITLQSIIRRIVTLLDPAEWIFIFFALGAILLPVGAIRIAMRSGGKRRPIRYS
jgi:hypothetical protein